MSQSQFLIVSAVISITAYFISKKILAISQSQASQENQSQSQSQFPGPYFQSLEKENRELNAELYLFMEEEKCLKAESNN